jgi:phosphatidylglycerol---prolipoprotein diacylglyceryl transferase
MYPILLHIYGPFNIYSFSIMLGLGLLALLTLAGRRVAQLGIAQTDTFINGFVESALAGIIGGRILHILREWHQYTSFTEMVSIWHGGLSILGAILAALFYALWYTKRSRMPLLPALDAVALYAPLAHAIARLGCFLAGCCYGKPTALWWAITYTNPEVVAPLHVQLHPTQLYSSLFFLAIFLFIRFVAYRWCTKSGEIVLMYLMCTSLERGLIDFLRGDRMIDSSFSLIPVHWLSWDQWIALSMFSLSCIGFIFSKLRAPAPAHEPV